MVDFNHRPLYPGKEPYSWISTPNHEARSSAPMLTVPPRLTPLLSWPPDACFIEKDPSYAVITDYSHAAPLSSGLSSIVFSLDL